MRSTCCGDNGARRERHVRVFVGGPGMCVISWDEKAGSRCKVAAREAASCSSDRVHTLALATSASALYGRSDTTASQDSKDVASLRAEVSRMSKGVSYRRMECVGVTLLVGRWRWLGTGGMAFRLVEVGQAVRDELNGSTVDDEDRRRRRWYR